MPGARRDSSLVAKVLVVVAVLGVLVVGGYRSIHAHGSPNQQTPATLGYDAGQYLMQHPPSGTLAGTTPDQLARYCSDIATQVAPRHNQSPTGAWVQSVTRACVDTVVHHVMVAP
jgi:hypothetical protein